MMRSEFFEHGIQFYVSIAYKSDLGMFFKLFHDRELEPV